MSSKYDTPIRRRKGHLRPLKRDCLIKEAEKTTKRQVEDSLNAKFGMRPIPRYDNYEGVYDNS